MALLLATCATHVRAEAPLAFAAAAAESVGAVARAKTLPEPVPFDSATAARHRFIALRLAAAMGTGDTASFRALHSAEGWAKADDWWQAMLANQQRSLGRIVRVVGTLRGVIRMGATGLGLPPEGAAILCHLGDQAGASMSFTLDSEGKIATASVWVARELAGLRPEGAEVLWEADSKPARRP
jgi:hypothetical protein